MVRAFFTDKLINRQRQRPPLRPLLQSRLRVLRRCFHNMDGITPQALYNFGARIKTAINIKRANDAFNAVGQNIFIFRTAGTVPIAGRNEDLLVYDAAFKKIAEYLRNGELVCIFPEGKLTGDGEINEFKGGIERILAENPVPVIPMALKGLWGSFFSRDPDKGVFRRLWSRIQLVAGAPLGPECADRQRLQAQVAELRGDLREVFGFALEGGRLTRIEPGGGRPEDRALDGRGGIDTAEFLGAFPDFDLAVSEDGTFTVSDRGGAEGTDTLVAIEELAFSDLTLTPVIVDSADGDLIGSNDVDIIVGRGGANEIEGAAGNDLIGGRSGDDLLRGNEGEDTLHGHSGDDSLFGNFGDDLLFGGSGIDRISGGADNVISGWPGRAATPPSSGMAAPPSMIRLSGPSLISRNSSPNSQLGVTTG